MSKGDWYRPVNAGRYATNYDKIDWGHVQNKVIEKIRKEKKTLRQGNTTKGSDRFDPNALPDTGGMEGIQERTQEDVGTN